MQKMGRTSSKKIRLKEFILSFHLTDAATPKFLHPQYRITTMAKKLVKVIEEIQ
jgi:hypothetical protein